jgi:hypothetical protein
VHQRGSENKLLRGIIFGCETLGKGCSDFGSCTIFSSYQRIWPLCLSPTPFRKPPFGAVDGIALGKDPRKGVLTEQRFPNASAKGKTSAAMRIGPAEDRTLLRSPSFGMVSKVRSGFQGSTQEPWKDPFGDHLMVNGWDLGSTWTWSDIFGCSP